MERRGGVNKGRTSKAIGHGAGLVHYPGAEVLAAGVVFLNPHEFVAWAGELGCLIKNRRLTVQRANRRNAGVRIALARL